MQHIIMVVGELCGVPGERLLCVCRVCGGDCGCDEQGRGQRCTHTTLGGRGCSRSMHLWGRGDAECTAQRRWVSDCERAELRQQSLHSDSGAGVCTLQHIVLDIGDIGGLPAVSVDARAADCGADSGGSGGDRVPECFTFDAPVASFVQLNMPHSFGGSVTVSGAELPVCGVHSDGTAVSGVCSTTSWSSATMCSALRVRCGMLRGAVYDVMRAVEVTVGGVVGTSTEAFSFDAPVASFVS